MITEKTLIVVALLVALYGAFVEYRDWQHRRHVQAVRNRLLGQLYFGKIKVVRRIEP
jgi:hypothetical protein